MKTNSKKALYCLKKGVCRMRARRRVWVLATVQFFFTLSVLAQDAGAGAGAFNAATDQISGYQGPVQKLLYAIAAVIALVGAFNVYHKMTNGDQDVKKTIMLTLGGCIAMVALSTALPAFFK